MRNSFRDKCRIKCIMGNAIYATSALALAGAVAAGPASAADMMQLGVGGYMEQWFGYANRGDKDAMNKSEEGGWAAQSDAEIHFKGSLESDAGLKFSVHIELEGDRGSSAIDESFARISGGFGQLEFGARDHGMVRMHESIGDVGIGLNAGDTQKWIPGAYLDTAGHAFKPGTGNDRKLNYFTPRVSGIQLGVSYAPKDTQGAAEAPAGNDEASWGVGLNFKQEVGDMAVTLSAGHANASRSGSDSFTVLTNSTAMPGMTHKDAMTNMDTWNLWENQPTTAADIAGEMIDHPTRMDDDQTDEVDESKVLNLDDLRVAAAAAKKALEGRPDMSVMKSRDDQSYSNFGVGVGFGAFKFNVAYATVDMGTSYELSMDNGVVIDSTHMWDHDGDGCAALTGAAMDGSACNDANGDTLDPRTLTGDDPAEPYTADVTETAANDDPSNDEAVTQSVVEAASMNYDVWGVSVTYTDGPMAVSLGHMTHEEDAGGERTATMLSTSYTLAPGVSWRTSIFGVEDDTSEATGTDGMNEGTGFVTGIKLAF